MHREQTRVTRSWEWRRRWVVLSGPLLAVFGEMPAAHRPGAAPSAATAPAPDVATPVPLCSPDNVQWCMDLTAGCHVEVVANDVRDYLSFCCACVGAHEPRMLPLQSLDAVLEAAMCFGVAVAPHVAGVSVLNGATATGTFSGSAPTAPGGPPFASSSSSSSMSSAAASTGAAPAPAGPTSAAVEAAKLAAAAAASQAK